MKMKIVSLIFGLLSMMVFADNEDDVDFRLESTFRGDKEQPSVSYFIPWQGIGTPDKLQWALDSKYDQTLDMVDREVMLRSAKIYNEMNLEKRVSGSSR